MIGIFHHNKYNAFPLADDIMEPYRPFVDTIVYEMYTQGLCTLDKYGKTRLASVLTCDVMMNDICRPLQVALTYTTASVVKYMRGDIKALVLPNFV